MKPLAALALIASLALSAAPASAHPRSIRRLCVVNDTRYTAHTIRRVERAVAIQVNGAFSEEWLGGRRIQFGRCTGGAWRIEIVPQSSLADGTGAYHSFTGRHPFAVIGTRMMSVDLSHEVLEMLVNPYADEWTSRGMLEVCDPVEDVSYEGWHGVWLSDWVTPAWFTRSTREQVDAARMIHRAGSLRYAAGL